ncbi:MAG: hypothetical protein IPN09_11545 [Bacteroidetes bacterium]|nr:hypothetical protein [Bacteroidota bacterium]
MTLITGNDLAKEKIDINTIEAVIFYFHGHADHILDPVEEIAKRANIKVVSIGKYVLGSKNKDLNVHR